MKIFWIVISIVVALVAYAQADQDSAKWDPAAFASAQTIEIRTIGDDEGEYWFPVWVVVIEERVFVRLGTKAADRIKFNTMFPDVGVRVGETQFNRVHAKPATAFAERVEQAMADKYWTDIFVRWFAHPLTAELVPLSGTPRVEVLD